MFNPTENEWIQSKWSFLVYFLSGKPLGEWADMRWFTIFNIIWCPNWPHPSPPPPVQFHLLWRIMWSKLRRTVDALSSDFQSQRYSELTQGNQGRDLLVGGLYIIVVFDLEKLKQLTIFSFPPLSLSLGCLSVCLGLFGCLEFLNIWEWNQAKWYTIFQCSNKISSITYENSSSCWIWISGLGYPIFIGG